jgi:WD40 repeat protein
MVATGVHRLQKFQSRKATYEKELAKGRESLAKGMITVAARHIRRARSQDGFERSPEALDVWLKLYRHLPKTGFKGAWEIGMLDGHQGDVNSVAVSEDACFALSGSSDGTAKLWEVATGLCIRTLRGHRDAVNSVSLSQDGRIALTGSSDRTLRLWKTETGRCLRIIRGHKDRVDSVCLSRDGSSALSCAFDETVRLWETRKGRCVYMLDGFGYTVTAACFSADERCAFFSDGDDTFYLFQLANGRIIRTFQERDTTVRYICTSQDGHFVLSEGFSEPLRLWEVATGKCVRTFESEQPVGSVCLTYDGRFALSADEVVQLWDVSSGKCVGMVPPRGNDVKSICLSHDGHLALSGEKGGVVRVWILDWELGDGAPSDSDEGERPYLDVFVRRKTPYRPASSQDEPAAQGEIPVKLVTNNPSWSEDDFKDLLATLSFSGYGWIKPEAVRVELERMASNWQPPAPLYFYGASVETFRKRLYDFALKELGMKSTWEMGFFCHLIPAKCRDCGFVPVEVILEKQPIESKEFHGVITGKCFECGAISGILSFIGVSPEVSEEYRKLLESMKDVPAHERPEMSAIAREKEVWTEEHVRCECGNPHLFVFHAERYESVPMTWFDEAVVVALCFKCGRKWQLAWHD